MASVCSVAILFISPAAYAEEPSSEKVSAVLKSLQERVAVLEERSRIDQAELRVARQKIRAAEKPAYRVTKNEGQPPASFADASARIVVPELPSGFAGPYVAITGGSRFTSNKQAYNYYGDGYYAPPASQEAMKGANVGLAAGYNVTSNNILFGFEGRFRKEFDNKTSTNDYTGYQRSLPSIAYTSCCSYNPTPTTLPYSTSDFLLSSRTITKDRVSREYGGDLSGRFGLIWNDTLFYTRIGAGIDAIRRENTVDQSQSITCVNPTGNVTTDGPYGYTVATITDCGSRRRGAVTKTSTSAVAPYALLGAGIEQNFGAIFVRLEGNLFTHFSPTEAFFRTNTYYTTEINGAVGYRF